MSNVRHNWAVPAIQPAQLEQGGTTPPQGPNLARHHTGAALFRSSTQVLPSFGLPGEAAHNSTEIPDARGTLRNQTLDAVQRNRAITVNYLQFARLCQQLCDPGFRERGTSARLPNWFAFGASASVAAGRGILAAHDALDVLERAADWSRDELLEALLLPPLVMDRAVAAARVLEPVLGRPFAPALLTFLLRATGSNVEVLLDPRAGMETALRFLRLLRETPGETVAAQARGVFSTMERILAQGNHAIMLDIGCPGQDVLETIAQAPQLTPRALLVRMAAQTGLLLHDLERVHAWALAHAHPDVAPEDFGALFPELLGERGRVLVLVGLCLFLEAGREPAGDNGDRRANALLRMGNNLIAFHEQFNVVQPAFARTLPGETDRMGLMQAMTPTVALDIAGTRWTFAAVAQRLPPPDGEASLLHAPATRFNWGVFDHRWRGIMDAFAVTYPRAELVWPNLPQPDPRAQA